MSDLASSESDFAGPDDLGDWILFRSQGIFFCVDVVLTYEL
jgi:hypothetical protein